MTREIQSSTAWYTEDIAEVVNSTMFTNMSTNETLFKSNTDQPTLYFITQVLYALVCIVGLFGNSLVIYVVLRFSKMQTVTNMYIVNLAIADECFLIGIPFLIATMNLQLWPFGEIMCKIYMTTTSINQFTSSIFLTIMSADRYVAVCHPISAPKVRTPMISKVVSLSAWMASGFLVIPVFKFSTLMNNSCNIIWPEMENLNGQTVYTLYSFVLGFVIPLGLILCFYVLIIMKLITFHRKNKTKEMKKSHRKVTKLILTLITVYIVCWVPYWIMQITLIYNPPKQYNSDFTIKVFLLVGILSYSNSAMNPILYAFLSADFQKSFLKACACITPTGMRPEKSSRMTCVRGADDEYCTTDTLGDHSTAITTRSNVTVTSDTKESTVTTPGKNGVKIIVPPTDLLDTTSSRNTVMEIFI